MPRIEVSDALASLHLDAHTLDVALRNALKLSERWLAAPPVEMKSLVRDIVERVTVAADRIEIRLSRANVAATLEAAMDLGRCRASRMIKGECDDNTRPGTRPLTLRCLPAISIA